MNIKSIFRFISFASLFLIPVFPLIVTYSLYFPFITGKAFYFRLFVELAFASWAVLAFMDAKYRPRLTSLNVAVTLFALITLIADLLGVNMLRSIWSNFERMEGWITIIHLWAFFIATTGLFGAGEGGKRLWHRWLNTSLAVSVIVAIYGFFQLFGWVGIHQGATRVDASLGNSAYMGVYMIFSFFLAAYFYFVTKSQSKKVTGRAFLVWAYPIAAVAFGFLVFETQTRGSILGLLGGIMLALFLYAILGKKEKKNNRLWAAGILVAIVLIGVIFWLNRNSSFVKSSEVLNRIGSISLNDTKTQARAFVWPMAIKGFTQRPILGWGQENFNYIFNANFNPQMYNQEQWFDRAHSVFLDWLVASGFLGLISYLSLYVLFLIMLWKSDLNIREKSVLTGLIAAYAVHNVFVFDNLSSYVLFFAVLAFINSLREGKAIKLFGKNPVRMDAVEYIVLPIVIILLGVTLYFVEIKPVNANTRLIDAMASCDGSTPDASLFVKAINTNSYMAGQETREQVLYCTEKVLTENPSSKQLAQAYLQVAIFSIQSQIAATPKDARIYFLAGSMLNNLKQYPGAISLLEKAHELSPTKQSFDLPLASAYLNNNQIDKGVALLREAYYLDKNYTDARDFYIKSLILNGKESEAKQEFKDQPEVLKTIGVAHAYFTLERYGDAVPIYQALVQANPDDFQLKLEYANVRYLQGYHEDAINIVRAVEKDHPEYTAQLEQALKKLQTQ